MNRERFQKVREAVVEARRLESEQRVTYLDELCGEDVELRREIETLLNHDITPAKIIQTGALAEGLGAELAPALDKIRSYGLPKSIGPYQIIEQIGEGGMGLVYRALQTEPMEREVALKWIKRGLDTDRVVARFRAELQTLARMAHPNVAAVYDAGSDESGRPYFVMELVDGEPITDYCDARRLTTTQRLRLYLEVCAAVRHAHQKGIIHRDLKPSNIMVTEHDGKAVPKIIDFGIAKAIEEPIDGQSMFTLHGQLVGTPEYMSPEQAGGDGEIVDTRSDVYSLGVVLYELLAGNRPYSFERNSVENIRRVLGEGDPLKPSTSITRPSERLDPPTKSTGHSPTHAEKISQARRCSVQKLRQQLCGDLDNIVMMAMRKEPDRRYGSVESFADDIRSQLEGMPVHATEDTWGYRTRKFLRRHAAVAAVGGAFVLLLLGFAVTMAVQSARVSRERDRAVAAEQRALNEADTAQQVLDFMVGLFDSANPYKSAGSELTVREVLEQGAESVAADLGDKPEIQAPLLHTIGNSYHSIGLYARADSVLKEALALRNDLYGPDSPQSAETMEVLGVVAHDLGEHDRSIELTARTLEILRSAAEPDSAALGRVSNGLAISLQAAGRLEEAELHYRNALSIYRDVLGEGDPEVGWALATLGWVLHSQGKFAEARASYEEALELQRRTLPAHHPDMGNTLNNLAGIHWDLGHFDQAAEIWQDARDLYDAVYVDDHPARARALFNLARGLKAQARYGEAEPLQREAMEMNLRSLGRDHPYSAGTADGYGDLMLQLGRLEEAERLIVDAMEVLQQSFPENHPRLAVGFANMCALRRAQARWVEAEEHARKVIAIREANRKPGDRMIADAKVDLADILIATDRLTEAEALAREALAAYETSYDPGHWRIGRARSLLGASLSRDASAGLEQLESGYEILASTLPSARPERIEARDRLLRYYESHDMLGRARDLRNSSR